MKKKEEGRKEKDRGEQGSERGRVGGSTVCQSSAQLTGEQ